MNGASTPIGVIHLDESLKFKWLQKIILSECDLLEFFIPRSDYFDCVILLDHLVSIGLLINHTL